MQKVTVVALTPSRIQNFFFLEFCQKNFFLYNITTMAKEHKKEKKVKASKTTEDETPGFLSPIAHPLAEKDLSKKIFKTIKKGKISNTHYFTL